MLFTEFDEKKYQEYLIREAREEGREEERMRAIKTMYTLGIPVAIIADKMQMTEKEVTMVIKAE